MTVSVEVALDMGLPSDLRPESAEILTTSSEEEQGLKR